MNDQSLLSLRCRSASPAVPAHPPASSPGGGGGGGPWSAGAARATRAAASGCACASSGAAHARPMAKTPARDLARSRCACARSRSGAAHARARALRRLVSRLDARRGDGKHRKHFHSSSESAWIYLLTLFLAGRAPGRHSSCLSESRRPAARTPAPPRAS